MERGRQPLPPGGPGLSPLIGAPAPADTLTPAQLAEPPPGTPPVEFIPAAAASEPLPATPPDAAPAADNFVNDFFSGLGDTAAQFGSLYRSIKGEKAPAAPKPAAAARKDNTGLFVGIGAGVIVLVVILIFALRK